MDMKNFFTRCSIYDSPLIQKKYHVLRENTREMTKVLNPFAFRLERREDRFLEF